MTQAAVRATPVSALFVVLCCISGCISQQQSAVPESLLEFYRQQTVATDPGEYASMYEGLPESLEELCALIKHQLTHPIELGALRNELPEERHFEDLKYPTVREMLAGLHQLDPEGLHLDRRPQNRLIVACWHHAMLLASILKYRGVPTRVRAGFALYIAPETGLHVGHAICEVWNDEKGRWMLVDPDRQKVDFRRAQFELPADAWFGLRREEIEPGMYYAATFHRGPAILHALFIDLKSVLNDDSPYWAHPRIVEENREELTQVTATQMQILDRIATFLDAPYAHFDQLRELREQHEFLR